jgi:hypothetical protein
MRRLTLGAYDIPRSRPSRRPRRLSPPGLSPRIPAPDKAYSRDESRWAWVRTWNGTATSSGAQTRIGSKGQNPDRFSSFFHGLVEDVEVWVAVEDRAAGTPYQSRRWAMFSHKGSGLHRGFGLSCGIRGKHGQGEGKLKPDFQNSSIAQLGFRKQVQELNSVGSVASDGFPLFPTQLRGLLSFSII